MGNADIKGLCLPAATSEATVLLDVVTQAFSLPCLSTRTPDISLQGKSEPLKCKHCLGNHTSTYMYMYKYIRMHIRTYVYTYICIYMYQRTQNKQEVETKQVNKTNIYIHMIYIYTCVYGQMNA